MLGGLPRPLSLVGTPPSALSGFNPPIFKRIAISSKRVRVHSSLDRLSFQGMVNLQVNFVQ
jgi:hypothetical protein